MRRLIFDAVAETREVVDDLVHDLQEENRLSDSEVLRRYVEMRGDPQALVQYAAQYVGPERAVQEARRYAEEMEKLLRKQGG